jgi:hypothetical protein
MLALVKDLGRPERFLNMLRVVKVTSPMSVGTWILTAYGPFAGLAAVSELRGLLPRRLRCSLAGRLLGLSGRPAGLAPPAVAPAVASYTAVLLTDTATPTWHAAHRHLPFVFVGSACAASGGLGMIGAPVAEAGPARRLALGGALLELAVEHKMEQAMGITAEPLHSGHAGQLMRASKLLTVGGAAGTALLGGRSRSAAVLSGAALMAGSACCGSACSTRGKRRLAIPATPWYRSASGWLRASRSVTRAGTRPPAPARRGSPCQRCRSWTASGRWPVPATAAGWCRPPPSRSTCASARSTRSRSSSCRWSRSSTPARRPSPSSSASPS